jgi:hypothetical protein
MTGQIDYESIELPDSRSYDEWTYAQRRAFVLFAIREVGHPNALNQRSIARQFDVDPSTIHNDLDVLSEYLNDTLGDRRVLTTDTVVQRSIRGLLDEEEYRKAAKTAMEWSEWVARERELSEMQEQLAALVAATQGTDANTGESEDAVELPIEDDA